MGPPEDKAKGGLESLPDQDPGGVTLEEKLGDVQACIKCPICGYGFMTKANGKCKLRTRVLVFADNGSVMGICPKCKTNLKVPVTLEDKFPPCSSGSADSMDIPDRRDGGRKHAPEL